MPSIADDSFVFCTRLDRGCIKSKGKPLSPNTTVRPPNRRIGYNSIFIGYNSQILVQKGSFRDLPIWWCHYNLSPTDPCCHGNRNWVFEHKIGYNSACMGDMSQILVPTVGFQGQPVSWFHWNWRRPTPVATVTKRWLFWHKIGNNSAGLGDKCQILVYQNGVSGVRQCNGIIKTGVQPTPVAMVTKFLHVATKVWHL